MEPARQQVSPADEIIDVLLAAPTPDTIIGLRPSPAAQARLSELLDRNRDGNLMDADRIELDAFLQVEHFVRRLKLRARELLAAQA